MPVTTIHEIVDLFDRFEHRRDRACPKMFCSTCGGLAGYVKEHLTAENRQEIRKALEGINPGALYQFGRWEELVASMFQGRYRIIIQQMAVADRANLNLDSPVAVDRFLFEAWKNKMLVGGKYLEVIETGIELALSSNSVSLVETLILILGNKSIDHPELVRLAIELSRDNEQIQRVLYNKLREHVDEVRDYKGDGHTFYW